MQFRIADTFTASLARLAADEQKAAKTTAFDLQVNPASPGLSLHKLDKARDKNFWSLRATSDLRVIIHKTQDSLLLCYVDHHDKAYKWAEQRKLETHPITGAAQLVEIRETLQEIVVPIYVERKVEIAPRPLFAKSTDEELLLCGVPAEWLNDVRAVCSEDELLAVASHLPAEAGEALINLATGVKPPAPAAYSNPFEHPDAQRRFRVMSSIEELERALRFPWDKWTVFLHPDQRQLVERSYAGPARVSGSAGTGKTIVALHRAAFLARSNPDARILLTTFTETLANAVRAQLNRLICNEPMLAERLEVYSIEAVGARLYKALIGPLALAPRENVAALLKAASLAVGGHKFTLNFLLTEWEQVVDAWQLESWESYRDVTRLGRKTRLSEPQRRILWAIFERVQAGLSASAALTSAAMFTKLARVLSAQNSTPFDFVIVDEAQDIAIAHLRFFAALGGQRPNALFFAGDLGQRIFQTPFSWKELGVDVRGRSRSLRVNYRMSHQIRSQADRLLGHSLADVDGNTESRDHTVSVFNGPAPVIRGFASESEEAKGVASWINERIQQSVAPQEIAVFVRSAAQLERARAAVTQSGVPFKILDENVETTGGFISISTMHLAKGLEFRAVIVMACDDAVIPSQERIESVGDEADLQEVYDTERHLLYVACTRARDHLSLTCIKPGTEFLQDLA